MEHCIRVMSEVARNHVAAWHHDQTVEAEREMHVLASEMVGRSMFRVPEAQEVVRLARDELPTLVQGLGVRAVLPDFFTRVPLPVNRRFEAACDNFRAATDRLVAAYRERSDDLGDFVAMLLRARDARTETTLSDAEIRDQVMTLLIAGIETPATTLTWALYELASHAELRAQLEAEVDEVLGGRGVEPADLPALRHTEAFVLENLRLHHPLWMLMRRAVRPVTLAGVRVEPGTEVMYSPAAMHRDPAFFPDPARFFPARWLDGTMERRAFIPFGLGNRQCIGDTFAVAQMKIALAAVVDGCRLTLPADYRPRTIVTSIVHLDRLPLTVRPRTFQHGKEIGHDSTARR
jgi:cytochrome P450